MQTTCYKDFLTSKHIMDIKTHLGHLNTPSTIMAIPESSRTSQQVPAVTAASLFLSSPDHLEAGVGSEPSDHRATGLRQRRPLLHPQRAAAQGVEPAHQKRAAG